MRIDTFEYSDALCHIKHGGKKVSRLAWHESRVNPDFKKHVVSQQDSKFYRDGERWVPTEEDQFAADWFMAG